MLLGFISLLLTVSQGMIQRICIPLDWTIHMLPCHTAREQAELSPSEAHGLAAGILGLTRRRLLAEGGPRAQHCRKVCVDELEQQLLLHAIPFKCLS
jgi:mlo protein